MEIINQPRGSGKTTKLIKKSAETGAVIVVATVAMADSIALDAKVRGYKIPKPISWRQYQNQRLSGKHNTHILIDEVVFLLRTIFSGVEIDAVTLTEEDIK